MIVGELCLKYGALCIKIFDRSHIKAKSKFNNLVINLQLPIFLICKYHSDMNFELFNHMFLLKDL